MTQLKKITPRTWSSAKIVLVLAAILAIFAYPYIPKKSLDLLQESEVWWGGFTDSFVGGNSEFTYANDNWSAIECVMGSAGPFNLCGNAGVFADNTVVTHDRLMSDLVFATEVSDRITRDLSGYSGVWVDLEYRGPANFIHLSLQNHEPAPDLPDPNRQLRPQTVGIATAELSKPIYVSLEEFKAGDWWITQFALHRTEAGTRFDHIRAVLLEIKEQPAGTEHYLEVRSIRFVGEWISKENFYLGIIIAFAALLSLEGTSRIVILYRKHRFAEESLQVLHEYNQQLQSAAFKDELTQLLNRRAIHEIARKNLGLKSEKGLAIFILDIDHFKCFNDTYGHALGDRVLVNVAQSLKRASREYDQVARWGGEEFVIVTRESLPDNLLAYAEKLRETVASTPVYEEGHPDPIFVTISVGITQSSMDEDFDVALERADKALYRSKEKGRNCCTMYDSDINRV